MRVNVHLKDAQGINSHRDMSLRDVLNLLSQYLKQGVILTIQTDFDTEIILERKPDDEE